MLVIWRALLRSILKLYLTFIFLKKNAYNTQWFVEADLYSLGNYHIIRKWVTWL